MKETSFIDQKKKKWKSYERVLTTDKKDPEALNEAFVHITDDLSHARTFYPNRSVRVYLNSLAQQVFQNIYKTKALSKGGFMAFWKTDLPRLIYESRRAYWISFGTFFLAILIGVFSALIDPEFLRIILGDAYVDMTIENINNGDPFAVYKQGSQIDSAWGITLNNLRVCILTFISGAFFIVGAIGILMSNGIMFGSFMAFFYENGLLGDAILTVMLHGTLELYAIMLAGAAAITMGEGLVFPKSFNRMQSFLVSARRGGKLLAAIFPVIILAGFVEGFFTRFTDAPDWSRLFFILLSLAFMLGYYLFYPYYVAKAHNFEPLKETQELPADKTERFNFDVIKTVGEIISDSFNFCRIHYKSLFVFSAIAALVFSATLFSTLDAEIPDIFGFEVNVIIPIFNIKYIDFTQYYDMEKVPLLPYWLMLAFSILAIGVYHNKDKYVRSVNADLERPKQHFMLRAASVVLVFACHNSLLWLGGWGIFFYIISMPLSFMWAFSIMHERVNLFAAFTRSITMLFTDFGNLIALFISSAFILFFFSLILSTDIFWFYMEYVGWNFAVEQDTLDVIMIIIVATISFFVLLVLMGWQMVNYAMLFFSSREIKEAKGLYANIKEIGNNKLLRGLEQEA